MARISARYIFPVVLLFLLLFIPRSAESQSVRISGMSDLSLGTWMGSGDLTNQATLCIYTLGNANYSIRATGNGAGSAFTLSSGGSTVAYEVYFKDSGSFVQLTSGTRGNFTDANTTTDGCGGVNNATIKVVATAAALSAATAGSYSGTVTLLLESR